MEPKLPAPNLSPELRPGGQGFSPETLPLPPSPETGFEQGERPMERQGEAAPSAVTATPVLPTPVAIPVPPAPATSPTQPAADQGNPVVAADDDLIEKEWVDKAKKIIAETRDDPRRREQEVGKLQVDYLRKRYGKQLGSSDDLAA